MQDLCGVETRLASWNSLEFDSNSPATYAQSKELRVRVLPGADGRMSRILWGNQLLGPHPHSEAAPARSAFQRNPTQHQPTLASHNGYYSESRMIGKTRMRPVGAATPPPPPPQPLPSACSLSHQSIPDASGCRSTSLRVCGCGGGGGRGGGGGGGGRRRRQ